MLIVTIIYTKLIRNAMETLTITKEKYLTLKSKAELNEDLLAKLIHGLEDIKAGRIKPWKKTEASS